MLVRDLTIKALIPWVEKQLKLLHEVVTNRKSRWEEKMNMGFSWKNTLLF